MNDFLTAKQAQSIYKAFTSPLRRAILDFIGKGEKTVTQIHEHLDIAQTYCSFHLAVLKKAGLVKTRREHKYIHYSKNQEKIDLLIKVSNELLK